MKQPRKKKSLFRRILKWTGITFLLLIIAIISLPFLFKDKIIALAKEEANKNLNAKVDFGEFDLSIFSSFPDFRFKIKNVSVVGVEEFAGDTLANIPNLELDVNLMSVIRGDQYKVKSISLDSPRIFVEVLENGKASYDIAKPSTDAATVQEPEDTSATKFALKLSKLEIKNALIVYDDKSGNMLAKLGNFDFNLSGDFTQDIFLMEIRSEIQELTFEFDGIAYLKKVKTKLKVDMDMDMPNMKFSFKENQIDLNELSFGIDGFVGMPGEDINMDIKFNAKQSEFKSILSLVPSVYSKDFSSVQTKGKLALNAFAKGTYNDKQMPAFGAHIEIIDAMFKYPSLPKSVNNIQVNVDVKNPDGNPDKTLIDINKFHVEMAGNPVDVVMHVKTPVSDPSINGSVKGKIVLASVKEFIPLEKGDEMSGTITADVDLNGRMSSIEQEKYDEFKASGTVEIDKMDYKTSSLGYGIAINAMKLTFTPKFVELNAFDAKMGKSDIQADGKIEDFMQYVFKDSLIKGTFNLRSTLMDLNELAGPSSASAEEPSATTSQQVQDTTSMSVVEVPRNIDFVLNSSIGKLLYDKLDITSVAGNVVVRDARVTMSNLKLSLLDGSMLMSGFYDTKNTKQPEINFDLNVNDFDIQKTFNAFNTVQKMAPIGKYAKGKFTATLNNLSGKLNQKMEPDMNTLTGGGLLKTNNVSVEGFEPFVKLGESLKNDKLKKMDFSNVNLTYKFVNGRVQVDPFKTKIQNVYAEVSGSTGFDQTIDYKWDMEIPTKDLGPAANSAMQNMLSQANNKLGTNSSLPDKMKVTALIGGTVTKPVVKTGMKDAMKDVKNEVKEQVKEIIEQKKEEVIADVKGKAKEEADKILADAQKEADKIKAEAAKLAEQVRTEGNTKATELETKGGNPLEKIANKKLAEKLRKESDAKANKITEEANQKADKIMVDAKSRADEKLK